ncbi:transcriptional regulator, TetR family [Haloechinothrix alba]|uniref:Transcriptional regulator, TetR family n=1 Tax=Haloechinothrix alba TaxID=664784 RepID=A0A238XQ28_9PSEU|nr:TetR/AcrR family transcriptional regulator [Haloechinothrix alba]SNR60688.1 transcriptional regulator, TetR family [Haloechinothrix alba]
MASTTAQGGRHVDVARPGAEQRRQQLSAAAARLFHRYGFHQVSLANVANAVGITAPAVYRHFRNKHALLAGAIESGLEVVDTAFDEADEPLECLVAGLAGAALERRDLWTLLQRELRHLNGEERVKLQARFDDFVSRCSARVRTARPDLDRGELALVVTAMLATLASPSMGVVNMPRPAYQGWLTRAAVAVARTTMPHSDQGTPAASAQHDHADTSLTRSEQLLRTAIDLFHEHGYAAVSLDDIGAAVGLAGPSIYHHFTTKSELLEAAFSDAAHRLETSHGNHDGTVSLDELARSYIQLGVQQRQLFGVYVNEAINLPPRARRHITSELSANIDLWVNALRLRRPELEVSSSRVLVYAARAIVNDVVRVGHLHTRSQIVAELDRLVHAVLNA